MSDPPCYAKTKKSSHGRKCKPQRRVNRKSKIVNKKNMPHRRNGKIARLPSALRDQVNLQLDEGKTYRQITEWLAANGHPGFNHDNLYQWYNGGFQDWINQRAEVQNF